MKTHFLHPFIPLLAVAASSVACDVEPRTVDSKGTGILPQDDGGASDQDAAVDSDGGGGGQRETLARGYYLVESDYASINVSVWSPTGELLTSSLVSSSSEDPGLSAPFTSDVVPPSGQQTGSDVVLIDRSGGVLTWVDLQTATVTRQLDVKTGFESDPHDYVFYDDNTAFVPRFAHNAASGAQKYDRGGDLLIVNPRTAELTGSIDLSPAMQGDPRAASPDRAILAGGLIRVVLLGWDGVSSYAPARLVSVDPVSREITNVLVLGEFRNCTTLTLSPTGASMVVGCWGPWSSEDTLAQSGIVHVSVADEPRVLLSVPATALGNEQINSVAFTSPSTVVYTTFGRSDFDTFELLAPDSLRFLDLSTAEADEDAVITLDAAFALGDVRCNTVAKRCVIADASTNGGTLRMLKIREERRLARCRTGTSTRHAAPLLGRLLRPVIAPTNWTSCCVPIL
jgi:hypothetical protein